MTESCLILKCGYEIMNASCACFSMGGHRMVPSADEHFYCATKYAVTALTEGIRQELREANTRIRATVGYHQHKLCLQFVCVNMSTGSITAVMCLPYSVYLLE